MRRLNFSGAGILCLTCVMLLATTPSCKRKQRTQAQVTPEEQVGLVSTVHAADPRAAVQFVKGFYEPEAGAWRWTTGQFAVTLKPPKDAAQKGANLTLKFVAHEAVMKRLHSITLSAKVGTLDLKPETYTNPGEYTYTREVPASALGGDAVTVNFSLDKVLPAGEIDQRELGVIVSVAGLETK